MSADDVKKRFVNEIELRAYDDKYVDRNEEREILQIAIQMGVSVDKARAALAHVCDEKGYVLEGAVLRKVRADVEAAAADDGKVDEDEFRTVFAEAKAAMRGLKTDKEIKRMIVQVMEDTGNNKVKTGWFSDWYAALKKELGLV